MRTELYTDFETAKMLKELDFNEKCFGFFVQGGNETYILNLISSKNDGAVVASPTWQQAEVWLWEKHKMFIQVIGNKNDGYVVPTFDFDGIIRGRDEHKDNPVIAKNEGIKHLIKYLHSKINKR